MTFVDGAGFVDKRAAALPLTYGKSNDASLISSANAGPSLLLENSLLRFVELGSCVRTTC
jgi:hypothetical protein